MVSRISKVHQKFALTSPQAYFMPQLKVEGGEVLFSHENNICDTQMGFEALY